MIAEVGLVVVVLALVALQAFERQEARKAQEKLINALVARTPEQLRDLELTAKVKPIETPSVKTEPEFIPESEVSDERFKELIQKEVG